MKAKLMPIKVERTGIENPIKSFAYVIIVFVSKFTIYDEEVV